MASLTLTLRAGGPRTVVSVDESKKILTRFQNEIAEAKSRSDSDNEGLTVVETLDLSCRAWPRESLDVFRAFYEQEVVKTVKVLKVDDIIASLDTSRGLDSLSFFAEVFAVKDSVLEVVDLNDNAIGTRGVEALKSLFTVPPKLERIYMNNCGLSEAVAETFVQILTPLAPRLKSLALGRNQVGAEGARHIGEGLLSRCIALESLEYAGSRPLEKGTMALCQGLANIVQLAESGKTSLKILDLNDCNLKSGDKEDDPIHSLCKVLENSPQLTRLILRDGELEENGVTRVVDALRNSNPPLQYIDMGGNELGSAEGTESLASFIKEELCGTIEELIVDTNELEDDGVKTLITQLVGCSQLKKLNLQCNEILEEGLQAILDNRIPALKQLDLRDNLDMPPDLIESAVAMYDEVLTDLEEENNSKEAASNEVDELATRFQNAKLGS